MPSQWFGDNDFWGVTRFNGVELGSGESAGVLAGMAIARMRGAGPSDSGVITHTGDLTADDLKVVEAGTPDMTVTVNAGVCIVNGVSTGIAVAVSVVISAAVTNPYIAIIQINQSGVVSKKTGSESGSPVAPTPDANNMELGQVLVAVAMTEIENADCTDSRTTI